MQTVRAMEPMLVISAANATMLALGRFVFLPYQRDRVSSLGVPAQEVFHSNRPFVIHRNAPFWCKIVDLVRIDAFPPPITSSHILSSFLYLQVASAGLPEQNGQTHLAAGDRLAEEASFLMTTNDPAGFNLIDVMAWGALGHALGFAVLAANTTAIPH